MKTKYILTILLISILSLTLGAANTYTVDQNQTISLTTGYVNSMSETWNVVSTVTDKTLIISYTIGTENNYDYLTINNVDNSGNVTSQLLRVCGTKSGIVSTTTPNGRVQVVFTSDGSVCYANNSSVFSGINVTFSVNPNQIVGNGLFVNGNSYISGNVGIGKNTPQALLDVTGDIAGLAVTGTNIDSHYSDKLLPFKSSNKLILGWNYSGGRCEQSFVTNSPTLVGGFSFYNYKDDATTATHLMTIDGSGKVGIGTPTPSTKLQVSSINSEYLPSTASFSIQKQEEGYGLFSGVSGSGNAWLQAGRKDNSINYNLILQSNGGNVSIGTTVADSGSLLTVNGTIHAKEVKVDLTGALADFVFHPSYTLMPLNEVEQYVNTNNHLPEIPSAAEVSKNGLSIGEMQNKLLQKIEELTLYVIEQQKQIEDLKNKLK